VWWHTAVIPATQEVEIGGLWFKASPGTSSQDSVSKRSQVWWYTLVIPATWEAEVGEWRAMTSPDHSMRPYLKNKLKAKGLGHGSVVEHLPASVRP
jgi:hypothetical protein